MSTQTALAFILVEILSATGLFYLCYQKSNTLGVIVSGCFQGMLTVSTIVSALGIRDWVGLIAGSCLIFVGGFVGVLLYALVAVNIQKSLNLNWVDVKAF